MRWPKKAEGSTGTDGFFVQASHEGRQVFIHHCEKPLRAREALVSGAAIPHHVLWDAKAGLVYQTNPLLREKHVRN